MCTIFCGPPYRLGTKALPGRMNTVLSLPLRYLSPRRYPGLLNHKVPCLHRVEAQASLPFFQVFLLTGFPQAPWSGFFRPCVSRNPFRPQFAFPLRLQAIPQNVYWEKQLSAEHKPVRQKG